MLTGEIRNKVDALWTAFWTGGIANPLTVIEQISYLLFIKRLDEIHTLKERQSKRASKPIKDPIFNDAHQHLRWSKFKHLEPGEMFKLFQAEVFPFIKNMATSSDTTFARAMADAIFIIPKASLLTQAVELIEDIPMGDRDTKGDVYEYMLSKLSTAGQNGQFRTPRHIIKMMVELMQPKIKDFICDPACGTAGFLVAAGEYIRTHQEIDYHSADNRDHVNGRLFNGFDFDTTMLRIGSMNMMMHGVENPHIMYKDSLSDSNKESEQYTLILANPPFKGSLAENEVSKKLFETVKTKKTELLFLALMLRLLKAGGRCAVIVPDGVLFGSSKAHLDVRKEIIDNHRLEAVISLPAGVFKPYAGVSTGIMIFTKTGTGGTDSVWFYDMQADGYSLDDKRTEIAENDVPDVIKRWHNLADESKRKKTDKSFMVPVDDIRKEKYDLSINRYKQIVYDEVKYDKPKDILAQIIKMEKEIQKGLEELDGMLG